MLGKKRLDPELHLLPAHKVIMGNEPVDIAAKEVTGWRKMKKRNDKLCKIDTNRTKSLCSF